MGINRLDPDTNMSGLPIMVPEDDGGYVDYDDHVAEVERLTRERDEALEAGRTVVECADEMREEANETIERLREALDNLEVFATYLDPCPGWVCIPQTEWNTALAALAGEGDEDE